MSELAAFPRPVVYCATEAAEPRIVETNSAFAEYFEHTPTDTSLSEWLRGTFEPRDTDVETITATAAAGDTLDCFLKYDDGGSDSQFAVTREFNLTSVPDTALADADRALVFTPVREATPTPMRTEQVASILSHDLRNPLDVAEAHIEAAADTGAPEHFDRVSQAHDRMTRIIQDVLTLARGEDAIRPTDRVDVGTTARRAWETVETGAATLTLDVTELTLTADRDRLQRLFENLFRNSVEHGTPQRARGEALGDLEVTVGPTDGGFYVADNGTGIPVDKCDDVFTAGFSSTDGGTGLGLAIVERIAAAHGLAVDITESGTGGARFNFRTVNASAGAPTSGHTDGDTD